MSIAPLQLPSSQPFVGDLGLTQSLSQLGEVYKKAQNQQKLSDLGKGLASGAIDYQTAASQAAEMGSIDATFKFLTLAEARRKETEELAAHNSLTKTLASLDAPLSPDGTITLLDKLSTEAEAGYWDLNMMASSGRRI